MVATEMRKLPYKVREGLNISRDGLLPSFGIGGSGLILISLVLFVLSTRKKVVAAKPKAKKKQYPKKQSEAQDAATKNKTDVKEGDKKAGIEIDESWIDEGEDENDLFSDIEKVISLSHSAMEEDEIVMVLRKLNPDLLQFTDQLSLDVQERFTKQSLSIYIINAKRSEKSITPDQFRIQDVRMNELIRETIVRRFLPQSKGHLSETAVALIGNVYTLQEQAKIQQSTHSHAEDWRDMSVRNAVDVLKIEPVV